MWDKIAILGPGLLGGSIAKALKKWPQSQSTRLWGRRPASIEAAVAEGFGDVATTELGEAVVDADLVILATPIGVMKSLLENALPHLREGVIVTDLGSVKGRVVRELEPLCLEAGHTFVGSHPMAGSEKTGFAAATAELFQGAACIVTPTDHCPAPAVDRITKFWETLGCTTGRFTPEAHDELVARISHLPHLLASAIIEHAAAQNPRNLHWAGGGLRDTTRIAAGDVPMWTDIFLSNPAQVAQGARDLARRLKQLADFLDSQDEPALADFLANAKELRDSLGPPGTNS